MSGIYISKGMEMPKSCVECRFGSIESCNETEPLIIRCIVLDNFTHEVDWHEVCPLIEVPTPHDDLIGRETAKKTVRRALEVNCKNLMNTAVPMLIDYALNNAPTIIESEE